MGAFFSICVGGERQLQRAVEVSGLRGGYADRPRSRPGHVGDDANATALGSDRNLLVVVRSCAAVHKERWPIGVYLVP
jgi:hypothetical protein